VVSKLVRPHATAEYLVIGGIDKNLINYLEEAWNVLDVPLDHAFRIRVIRPDVLCYKLNATNVRVWAFEDVFQLGELWQIFSCATLYNFN
jgi:hypothetical protein